MQNLIEDNSYRILGLNTDSSQKEILRRYKEISNRLKIDDHPKYDFDLGLPEDSRNEDTIKEALKNLQSSKEIITEYFFWFQISNANDKRALDYIIMDEFPKAIELWKDLSNGKSANSYSYKKNLAILYCLMLFKGDNQKYLKNSISIWDELVHSEKFWIDFLKTYDEQNGSSIDKENLPKFKDSIVKEISDIYTDLGKKHKNPDYIKSFQEIFNVRGEKTEKELIQPAYQKIYNNVEEIKKIVISANKSQIDEKIGNDKLAQILEIIKEAQKNLNQLRKNGLYDTSESLVVRDSVAQAIRIKAIDLNNYAGLYQDAEELIKTASKIAGTKSYANALEGDIGTIQKIIKTDASSILTIRISRFLSSKDADFKPRFAEYDGTKIVYKDVNEISFNGVRSNYSTTYNFMINTADDTISFSFSDVEIWKKLTGLSYQYIIPFIVRRYVDNIFEKSEAVTIGDVVFTKNGYARPKFLGGESFVSWKEKIYIPQFFGGNVILYKEIDGRGKSLASIPMRTPNAVILPVLLQECVNRAVALGLIPAKIAPAPPVQKTQGAVNWENKPPEGFKTWQEYYDKIDRDQRPELLKAFVESGGEKIPKGWIDALKNIKEKNAREDNWPYNIDKEVIKQLIAKDYIKEEKGILSTKYVIQKKGFNILNWVYYKFK
jgi:hypothetical protein